MYMSPEQLSQDNGNHGYLGSAVDVWASGVLLIVMLVRRTLLSTHFGRISSARRSWRRL